MLPTPATRYWPPSRHSTAAAISSTPTIPAACPPRKMMMFIVAAPHAGEGGDYDGACGWQASMRGADAGFDANEDTGASSTLRALARQMRLQTAIEPRHDAIGDGDMTNHQRV